MTVPYVRDLDRGWCYRFESLFRGTLRTRSDCEGSMSQQLVLSKTGISLIPTRHLCEHCEIFPHADEQKSRHEAAFGNCERRLRAHSASFAMLLRNIFCVVRRLSRHTVRLDVAHIEAQYNVMLEFFSARGAEEATEEEYSKPEDLCHIVANAIPAVPENFLLSSDRKAFPVSLGTRTANLTSQSLSSFMLPHVRLQSSVFLVLSVVAFQIKFILHQELTQRRRNA